MVASAGRLMPRRVRTMRLAPTWSAPVLPAETKASPLPSLSIFRPTTMEESFFVRMALAGSSHISMASVQFTSSMPSREMLLSAAVLRTRASSPTPMSWTPYSFTAAAAPSSTARGALSPPIISTMIFIGFILSVSVLALSVTFGDSSPKGRATGVSVRPTLDEQSSIFRKQYCPASQIHSSLTRCACPEAAGLCSKARSFAPYRALDVQLRAARPANGSPFKGSWREAPERSFRASAL